MPDSTAPTPVSAIRTNLNFDPRIQSMPLLQADPFASGISLTRGSIFSAESRQTGKPVDPQGYHSLSFLYNPTSIQVQHSMNASTAVIPPYLRASDDVGVPLTASGGSLDFSLLFDRTYEVSDPSKAGTPAHDLGVLLDVLVLYGLCGITTPLSTKQGTVTDSTQQADVAQAIAQNASTVVGAMQMYPVWCVFPSIPGADYSQLPDISLMRYFGYISSTTVTYSHFTQRMIPDRCAVGISMTLMTSAGF